MAYFSLTYFSGVAVGSSIGHALGGFFGSGSSQADTQQTDSALSNQTVASGSQDVGYSGGCEESAKAFTRCLDENKGEYQMNICGWYFDQLVGEADATNEQALQG